MQNTLDAFPDVVRIETTGKCNFKCIHCPTGTEPNNRSVLSKERFDYIVHQFTYNNYIPRVVVLYHGGEPLLNKNLSHFRTPFYSEFIGCTIRKSEFLVFYKHHRHACKREEF